jgi:hypothetical protein
VLAAVGVLLSPAMLLRNDLKQYTADACLALLTLSLTSRVERRWSRSGLALLSASIWCGMLFSHTVAFVGATAFAALCVVQLAHRAWSRLIESLVAALCTAALMLAVYELFDAQAVDPSSTAVVHRYFPPVHQGWHATLHFLRFRFDTVHTYFGLEPIWLAGALFAVGVGTVFRLGQPATALTMLLIWPFMFAVSVAHKYPFLDERRNTFMYVITMVGAAIGVAGIAGVLHRWLRGTLSLAATAGAILALAIVASPNARDHTIPLQDTRGQGRFVAENAASNDVILVSMPSSFGFAYYWRQTKPSRRPSTANAQGYIAYFPTDRRIIVADDRTEDAVGSALDQAISRAHELGTHQVWLVRTHVDPAEARAWQRSLRARGVTASVVSPSGLALIRLTGAG